MSCKPLTKKEWQASVAEMWSSAVESTYQDLIDAAVKAEREACAKVCEERIGGAVQTNDWWFGFRSAMKQCATAIRARGQA